MDDKRTQMVSLRIPHDLAQDMDAVCHASQQTRSQVIIDAIRARLEDEKAAQRAREERKARKAFERRVAEARRQAEAIGAALHWDIKRIETFIALSPSDADGLLARELLTMQQERSADDSGGEK